MRRIAMWSAAAVLPALFVSALVGCGGGDKTSEAAAPPKENAGGGGKPTAIVATATGTLKGKVKVKGDKAATVTALKLDDDTKKLQEAMGKTQDAAHCLGEAPADQKEEQTWRIADDGGLANVIVYLKAPKGKFFSVDTDKVKFEKEKVLDQPHCAFVPHVMVLFPESRKEDNSKKATGQTLLIKNSAKMPHNTKLEPGEFNQIVSPGDSIKGPELKSANTPYTFSCSIHQFMRGYALALDHPYAAVTDKDGNFEIADVPADVEVLVTVWHEDGVSKDYEKGKEMKLKAKETTKLDDIIVEKK